MHRPGSDRADHEQVGRIPVTLTGFVSTQVRPLADVDDDPGTATDVSERRGWRATLLVLVATGAALAVFSALASLSWPSGRDQGIFEWIGGVILDGGTPYHDGWDMKGPLSYYVYAAALGIFGRHESAIRLLDLIFILATCGLIRALALRSNGGGRVGANFATCFFALSYYGGGFWNTAQPDAWGGALILGAMLLLTSPSPRLARNFTMVGSLIGLATLLKPSFVLFGALPLLQVLLEPGTRMARVRYLLACALGFVIPCGAAIPTLYAQGALNDFLDILRFISSSHASMEHRHLLKELAGQPQTLLRLGLLLPCLLAPAALVRIARAGQQRLAWVLGAWLALSLLAVVIQGKYWMYHWATVMMAVAPLLSVVLNGDNPASARWTGLLHPSAAASLICGAVLLIPAARALSHGYSWAPYVLGLRTQAQYNAQFITPDGKWRYSTLNQLADYIASHSSPGDRILEWGWDPLLNVLARRDAPTRFGFSYPLVAQGPLQLKYRQLFMQDISREPPRYIVVATTDQLALDSRTGAELLASFPQFDQSLRSHYKLIGTTDGLQTWRLNPQPSAMR